MAKVRAELNLQTRLHEATHAAVGFVLGWTLRSITVIPGEILQGFVDHERRTDLSPLALAADDCTIFLAGEIGERIAPMTGYHEPVQDGDAEKLTDVLDRLAPTQGPIIYMVLTDKRPGMTDRQKAEREARQWAAEERHQFLDYCRARAGRLVWSNVDLIQALEGELRRTPVMEGPPATAVMQAALDLRTRIGQIAADGGTTERIEPDVS